MNTSWVVPAPSGDASWSKATWVPSGEKTGFSAATLVPVATAWESLDVAQICTSLGWGGEPTNCWKTGLIGEPPWSPMVYSWVPTQGPLVAFAVGRSD